MSSKIERGVETFIPPASSPVLLEDIKTYLRVETNEEDALIQSSLLAATEQVENFIGQCLISRQFCLKRDRWESLQTEQDRNSLFLPRPPLLSVEAIRLYNEQGEAYQIATEFYHIDTQFHPGRIVLKNKAGSDILLNIETPSSRGHVIESQTSSLRQSRTVSMRTPCSQGYYLGHGNFSLWPQPLRPYSGIEICYTAGYGAGPEKIPAVFKQAVLLLAASFYEIRLPEDYRENPFPKRVSALLSPWRQQIRL